MKKKTAISIVATLLLVLAIGIYIYYQNNFLENTYLTYINTFARSGYSEIQDDNTVELYIQNYDTTKCEIQYCVLNNCDNQITLPCSKNSYINYSKPGNYILTLKPRKYSLFPLSEAQKLRSWSLESSAEEVQKQDVNYIDNLKSVVRDHYIWESVSLVVRDKTQGSENWIYNTTFNFSHNYLKSIYSMNLLAEKLEDEELKDIVEKEIEYLNENKEDVLSKRYDYAEPLILELEKVGLDNDFLSIYERYDYLNYEDVSLEPKYLIENDTMDFRTYNDIVKYADAKYYFDKNDYDELSQFYNYKTIQKYNSSDLGLIGLCALKNRGFDSIDAEELLGKLKEEYAKVNSPLFSNLYENIQCLTLVSATYPEEIELIDQINYVITNSSVDIDGVTYLLNIQGLELEDTEERQLLVKYNLLDNIEYVYQNE
jgi:hypothetical protein